MTGPLPAKGPGPWLARNRGGLFLALVIALAASFLAEHYGAPATVFALLIGMAFNFLAEDPRTAPGLGFSAQTLLRIGVALLGLRLTVDDVARLGPVPILGVVGLLAMTLATGLGIARLFGRGTGFGLLTAGAVAICGASAALAIAAVLPRRHLREGDVLLTVVGVTAFSTLAMILYPLLFGRLGLGELASGWLIGATVHDVAQVVGAGYAISESAGDIATFTKLLRVAMLPVVLLAVALVFRREAGGGLRLPWFVAAFVALMVAREVLPLPALAIDAADHVSRFLLVTAIAALGVRTSLAEIAAAGRGALAVLGAQTATLLAMALGFVALTPF